MNRSELEDPDYESSSCKNKREHEALSVQQQDAKEQAIQRIEQIVRDQFSFEIHLKEREIEMIDNRIGNVRTMLDRLRACVLARFYGSSDQKGHGADVKEERGDSVNASTRACQSRVGIPRAGFVSRNANAASSEKLSTTILNSKVGEGADAESKKPLSVLLDQTPFGNGDAVDDEVSRVKSSEQASEKDSQSGSKLSESCFTRFHSKKGRPAATSNGTRNGTSHFSHLQASFLVNEPNQSGLSGTCAKVHFGIHDSSSNKQSRIHCLSNSPRNLSNTTGAPLVGIEGALNVKSPLHATSSQSDARGSPSNVFESLLHAPCSQSDAKGSPLNAVEGISHAPSSQSDAKGSPSNITRKHCGSDKVPMSLACAGSRFYVKKRIIVGNTSKYISLDMRESNDKSTHKWMVYVRGPPEDPRIERFIKKVWFFLHPSYRPNDIVEVNKPPFHLTRRGWGEFPVRVQFHFVDPRNKRVDIIHELKLDRTYTGLQTLGAETVVDLELDRRTLEDSGIPFTSCTVQECGPSNSFSSVFNTGQTSDKLRHQNTSGDVSAVHFPCNQQSSDWELASHPPNFKKVKLESTISAGSSPVNSLPTSRCSSPDLKSVDAWRKFPDEIEELLTRLVREHPLTDEERNVVKHPYCAKSLQQFLAWNIGKRRACEWQRAAAIKRHLLKYLPSCKLSTKEVMTWCRRFGYTPVSCSEDDSFCKYCGGRVKNGGQEAEDTCCCAAASFTSWTPARELLAAAEASERDLPDVPQTISESEDLEIDVVGLEAVQGDSRTREGDSVQCYLPMTPQQAWVHETCSDLGITLRPLDLEGVRVHAVESLLLAACRRLAQDVLRHSSASAADLATSCAPRLIVPSHVHRALSFLPVCDFLRNMNMNELSSIEKDKE